jgi:heptosyltransferase II
MNILCICPIGIGNYLLCYPAFLAIKRSMPDASMHLLALREGVASLAHTDSLWKGITVIDPTKIHSPYKPFKVLHELRTYNFDASINFFPSNTWQYNLFPFLSGIPARYGFSYSVAPFTKLHILCNRKVSVDPELHDIVQNYRIVSFFLNEVIRETDVVFPKLFTENEKKEAKEYFSNFSGDVLRIGIHPGSSTEHGMDAKRWSPDKFACLADKIRMKYKSEIFIFGGPDEERVKRSVAGYMRNTAHIVPAVSLSRTAALLSECSLFISNDSGLMHIASCMNVPTAGIFGPTDERRNGPAGRDSIVVRKKMDGFPLWNAENVGSRIIHQGIDPMSSLKALSAEYAWQQIEPWISNIESSLSCKQII